MSLLLPTLRAVTRDELAAVRPISLATVTAVDTNADGSGKRNVEVNAQLHGSDLELQRVPVATGRIGLSAAPRVGDTVVVAFVGGDLNGPVVIGSLYDDQRHPPQAEPDEIVYAVPDEASSSRRIEITTAGGRTVTITDDAVTIVMGDTTLEVTADGAVTVVSATDISLEAQGDVSITAGKNLTLEASANVNVKASAQGTFEAQATTVKGSTTTIAGLTSFSAG
ncbi:MAG TPA: phage baseplate assembly protein V [Microlunatus sp.]